MPRYPMPDDLVPDAHQSYRERLQRVERPARWVTYTATLYQSSTVCATDTGAYYLHDGDLVIVHATFTPTTGSASGAVSVSLPVAPAATSRPGGTLYIRDASASTAYLAQAYPSTSGNGSHPGWAYGRASGSGNGTNIGFTGSGFTAALATNDTVHLEITYRAA